MAGTGQTNRFMMGSATLMLGPMSALYDLQPSTHSLGLVKNVTTSVDPTFADLTQGRENTVVFSALTGVPVKVMAEVFEYTVQNLGYALGLDGSALTTKTHAAYKLSGPTTGGETVLTFTGVGGLNVGDTLMFVDKTTDDRVLLRTITAVNGGTNQVTFNYAIPGVWTTAVDIIEVNSVPVAGTSNPPFLAAKIAGQLADGTPAVLLFAKVRIVKGFQMAWNAEQWQNMPFELQVLDMVPADPFYAAFPNRKGTLSIT